MRMFTFFTVIMMMMFRDLPCPSAKDCECTDLAYQLTKEHQNVHVVLGGGQQKFFPATATLPADQAQKGERLDGRNLAEEWLTDQENKGRSATYVDSAATFKATNFDKYDYVMGALSVSPSCFL